MGIDFTQQPKLKRSTNQNSGVRIDATDPNENKETYYGHIEEIWELDYGPYYKVPLFWCQWVRVNEGGVTIDHQYGMITVDLNNLGYRDEPFVLANDVNQVLYVKDMSTKPKKGKNNDSDNEPKHHMSEDYEKNDGIPPFTVNGDPSILLNNEDTPWLQRDYNQGTYVKKKFIAVPS